MFRRSTTPMHRPISCSPFFRSVGDPTTLFGAIRRRGSKGNIRERERERSSFRFLRVARTTDTIISGKLVPTDVQFAQEPEANYDGRGGGPLTVYNAIRKPLLLHPRRRFIPPMLFPPTMSWSAFSSNRFFSSWKKQTFRFVSFRFGNLGATELPRGLCSRGRGRGPPLCPLLPPLYSE